MVNHWILCDYICMLYWGIAETVFMTMPLLFEERKVAAWDA